MDRKARPQPDNPAMRAAATLILAKYLGQTLTGDVLSRMLADFPAAGSPIDLGQLPLWKCGRLTFGAERAGQILPELQALHAEHWKETEGYHRHIPMKADIVAGLLDEQEGRLLQLTARADGVLVGNFRLYLGTSRHTSRRIATEDTLYLLPEFRGGRSALRFIQYAEACLRLLDVAEVYLDDKTANPAVGKLLAYLGYEHIANRRHKHLTEDPHVRT